MPSQIINTVIITFIIISIGCTAISIYYHNYLYSQALSENNEMKIILENLALRTIQSLPTKLELNLKYGTLNFIDEGIVIVRINDTAIHSFKKLSVTYTCKFNIHTNIESIISQSSQYNITALNNVLKLMFNIKITSRCNQIIISIIEIKSSIKQIIRGKLVFQCDVNYIEKYYAPIQNSTYMIEIIDNDRVSRYSFNASLTKPMELIVKIITVEVSTI